MPEESVIWFGGANIITGKTFFLKVIFLEISRSSKFPNRAKYFYHRGVIAEVRRFQRPLIRQKDGDFWNEGALLPFNNLKGKM